MPASSPDAVRRKRERDNERRRLQRENPAYRESERQRDRERKQSDRELERRYRKRYLLDALSHFVDDWAIYDWENTYVAKRGGIDAYRPWLNALRESDLANGVVRLSVYKTTPLEIEERAELPQVWQTYRSATIRIAGLPLIKRFKVLDPKDPNPIPIGEGELVRRQLASLTTKRWIFPKSLYDQVTNAPVYFIPQAPPDLLEFDCEYVDISRCYSQLLERLPSLGIRFHYGRREFGPLDLPRHDGELLASKHWGRATVGMLRQRFGKCFVYGEPRSFPSRYYHGDTANWIHGILHCLASYAITECACFRWHTDGGFFPTNGGRKFSRLLDSLGLAHTLEEFSAVLFASLDQYEAIRPNGSVKQTRLFTSTYVDDYIFQPVDQGGNQRNNIIHNLNANWFFSTLEQA